MSLSVHPLPPRAAVCTRWLVGEWRAGALGQPCGPLCQLEARCRCPRGPRDASCWCNCSVLGPSVAPVFASVASSVDSSRPFSSGSPGALALSPCSPLRVVLAGGTPAARCHEEPRTVCRRGRGRRTEKGPEEALVKSRRAPCGRGDLNWGFRRWRRQERSRICELRAVLGSSRPLGLLFHSPQC